MPKRFWQLQNGQSIPVAAEIIHLQEYVPEPLCLQIETE